MNYDLCHCGRKVAVEVDPEQYLQLGPGPRYMCPECLMVRCDVNPSNCPYPNQLGR